MTTKQVLEAARAFIGDPSKWTTGELHNRDGRVCAVGAIARVTTQHYEYDIPEHRPAMAVLAGVIAGRGVDEYEAEEIVYNYNDENGHECVVAAFDAAIEKAS